MNTKAKVPANEAPKEEKEENDISQKDEMKSRETNDEEHFEFNVNRNGMKVLVRKFSYYVLLALGMLLIFLLLVIEILR